MLLRGFLYCFLCALIFAASMQRTLSFSALGWSFLQGLVLAATFFPVARWTNLKPAARFAIVWTVLIVVGVLTLASEGLIFLTLPVRQVIAMNVRLAIAYTALAAGLALLPKWIGVKSVAPVTPHLRSGFTTGLALMPASVFYVIVYIVFGGIFYQAFTKPYYTHQIAGGESLTVMLPTAVAVWFPLIQIARGALLSLAVLPLVRALNIRRASAAIMVGTILWVVGGLAPLLPPNPIMPGMLRLYHTFEIFTQNFALGLAVTWLMRRSDSRPINVSATTAA